MSFLIKTLKPVQILEGLRVAAAIQARQSHFLPDYQPGPLPKTEEERIRAARKYNLHPDEYETYEEGSGHGDFPKLPIESVDSRDPWYPWDIEEFRRDYNEPVNALCSVLIPETVSTEEQRPSVYVKALISAAAFCGVFTFAYLFNKNVHLVQPLTEKQLITPGVTHYTFEPDLEEAKRRKKKKKCEDEEIDET